MKARSKRIKSRSPRVITEHRSFYWPTMCVRVHDQTNEGSAKVFIRISVWGADDSGMEKDFNVPLAAKEETLRQVLRLADNLPNPLTREWLLAQGFQWG